MKPCFYILLLLPFWASSQDMHFSQWHKNPLFQSPALAGSFDGSYRITAHQREQWASVSVPFQSTTVGFDMPYKSWGFGAQFLRDQSGSSRLSLTQLSLLLSRSLENWRLGLQMGFVQQHIDFSDLVFIDNTEEIFSLSKSYIDLGLGLYKDIYFTSSNINIGYSIFHLNTPNRSFFASEDRLKVKHSLVSEWNYPLNSQWTLVPSMQWQSQQKQREWTIGSLLRLDISDLYYKNIQLEGGGYYRFGDAVSVLLGLHLGQSQLAFSYDWNVSELVPASNALGAWELSFCHIINTSMPRPIYKTCPAFL